jgi:hypothetical protein
MNTYAAQMPKIARWQAEILIADMTGAHGVEGALGDLHEVGTAARRATDFLSGVPGLIETEREMLAAERRAVLAGIDVQREQTLGYLSAERLAVLAAAREERIAVVDVLREERRTLLEAIRQERIAALAEADAIKTRAVESALAGMRDLIDYTLWRVAALCLCLMLVAAIFGVIAYRLTIGRHVSFAR